MKTNKILLMVTLLIVLVGVVSANEVTDDNNNIDTLYLIEDSQNTNDNSVNETINNKEIKKDNNNLKTESYKTTVSSYKELENKINEAKDSYYDNYTINLEKKTYYAYDGISWGNSKETKTLIIDGNNSEIIINMDYGNFFTVNTDYTLIFKNLKIKESNKDILYGKEGSKIIVDNCYFINNTESILYGYKFIVNNSQFINNSYNYGIINSKWLTVLIQNSSIIQVMRVE